MPGASVPFVGDDGKISHVWLKFLTDLHERTGGGSTDLVDSAVNARGDITSIPTQGNYTVTNIYINSDTETLQVDYDDTPA